VQVLSSNFGWFLWCHRVGQGTQPLPTKELSWAPQVSGTEEHCTVGSNAPSSLKKCQHMSVHTAHQRFRENCIARWTILKLFFWGGWVGCRESQLPVPSRRSRFYLGTIWNPNFFWLLGAELQPLHDHHGEKKAWETRDCLMWREAAGMNP